MILIQFLVFLAFIILGARIGGIGIAFAGGAGVLVLSLLGATPGDLPMQVIVFIMVVIYAASAMQVAGGLDYLVNLTDRLLRAHPKYLALLAPMVTYLLTFAASTGQVSFATMPVIVEVAKENNIRPTRSLSVGVAGSLLGITASPISAAVVFLSGKLEEGNTGWTFIDLILVSIPSTFLGTMTTALLFMLWDKARGTDRLDVVPEYQRRLAAGEIAPPKHEVRELRPGAKLSVLIFMIALVVVLAYSIAISEKVGLISDPVMDAGQCRISVMLAAAGAIIVACRANPKAIPGSSIFRTGMSACACILGVAWLGTTFMTANQDWIQAHLGTALAGKPWLFAILVVVASSLLYSQAASTKALFPTALAIGVAPATVVACFPATSSLFILPTYPTLLAAVELDDTGSTQLGTHFFDHPFLIPGLMATGLSVLYGFALAAVVV
ncbi:anaerobic C4-dicarboxylate transporter family protein [Actinomyces ruminis]|uniref:C4-dicarboxylate transporter DcuA n=1 Tax=Actinomyces ruminis TaxID=1937003 RepID=A0ABX4M8H7_9ACTO|nr:anaerobic C4-dicarboxylate transporter [Actinomyces ruminis]PHP51740.1 C4-dicarboxylate ABC transporter [Actinomyces ruminis]